MAVKNNVAAKRIVDGLVVFLCCCEDIIHGKDFNMMP
jgi:hypothetical protein